jgi:hypothetical protein
MRAQRKATYFIFTIRMHFLEEIADALKLEDDLTQLAKREYNTRMLAEIRKYMACWEIDKQQQAFLKHVPYVKNSTQDIER